MSRRRTLLFGWMLALVAIALFVQLGRWQAGRAAQKQAMLDAAATVLSERRAVPLQAAADPARTQAYDWSEGAGQFAAQGPLWLDNQHREGRPGVRVYRVFEPEASPPLLVDLGWLPLPPTRAMPNVVLPQGRILVRGLLTPPPSAGLPLGPGVVTQGEGWLLTRVDPAAIAHATASPRPLASRVLRLDPALPLGYARDLQLLSNTMPPAKHRAYSVQWFALALAVLVTALLLTFRKARHES